MDNSNDELTIKMSVKEWKEIMQFLNKMPIRETTEKNFKKKFTMAFYQNEVRKL